MNIKLYQPLAIHELGQRANQEDNIYPARDEATEQDRLFVLCDGMGGHEHGEVASQSVCQSLSTFLSQPSMIEKGFLTDEDLAKALLYAYQELDKLAIAGDTRQMGTTLTLLYFHTKGCIAAHIGDSRIYHLRPSTHAILYKSRDHSLAYDLYQAGELSYEEMKAFPQKNVITRAMIAGDRNHPKPDVVHIIDIQPGDYFYICSDGMLEQMEDEELLDIFSSEMTDEEKCDLLITKTANNRDNHSAHIIHVKDVWHDKADECLVNEEPTAKCNALNIKSDVVEVNNVPDVEVVKPIGTPPPVPDSVVLTTVQKQKRKKQLFVVFMVAVGMIGYGYYTKHQTMDKSFVDTVHIDSVQNEKKNVSKEDSLKTEKDSTEQQVNGK